MTENAAIANVERAQRFADEVNALGCGFALDDFGAGFASFYFLKHLDFDYLKIDGEYIHNLAEDATNQLLVRALVDIARGLGKRTIAEFVGDHETLELLRRAGRRLRAGLPRGPPGADRGVRDGTERGRRLPVSAGPVPLASPSLT